MTEASASTLRHAWSAGLNAWLREHGGGVMLALPAMIVLVFLYAAPLAHLLVGSFQGAAGGFRLESYGRILGDAYGRSLVWNSLRLGLITTGIALLVGYPAAFGLALSRGDLRSLFLASLFLPLAASVIAKAFAWTILLRSHGIVNDALMILRLMDRPIRMIFTQGAMIAGAANIFLPFMILPIYAVVAQIDPRLTEAAATLGAPPLAAFLRVVIPLSLPGVVAGVALVFSLSVSAYVVPTLLMGENYPTLATTIAKAFLLTRDPSLGAAAGAILIAIGLFVVVASNRLAQGSGRPRA
jgi:putative spermidine/putrescine transport system permease protein